MALLVGFIGCALHWDLKFAKKKEDTSLTTENIVEMLKRFGIPNIDVLEEGIMFGQEGSIYTLDCRDHPVIRFGNVGRMEDGIDLEIAKEAALEFNQDFVNATVQVEDNRMCYITSVTFADDIQTLGNALPSMTQYQEIARYHYLKRVKKSLLQPSQLRHSQDTKD